MGDMGADEFLGLRPLGFHPEVGKWYDFRIQVCGSRIRIFINNESIPRIDLIDSNMHFAPSGKVYLGGSWINTEFDSLSVTPLPSNALKDVSITEYKEEVTAEEKEKKRIRERAAYHPVKIEKINIDRTIVSLDGQWLFMPEYELSDQGKAVSPATTDNNWHVMNVPNFWNPSRIWLHGEMFGPHSKGVSDNYFQMETDRCANYTFDYKKTSAAWYREWVELPANIKGKNIEVTFDAVSKVAEVWINGTRAGSHVGMFGDFKINGTNLFKPGRNLIVVKVIRDYVKNIKDANKIEGVAVSVEITNKMLKDLAHGFYGYDPAGIWQPVHLIVTNPVKMEDVFIKPSLTGATFDVTLKNNDKSKKSFSIITNIVDKKTNEVLYKGISLEKYELTGGEVKKITFSVNGLKPKLWSPQIPNLYDFTFSLVTKDKEIDKTIICSGFRTFEAKNGFLYLNGNRYWLKGANQTPFALAPNSVELAGRFYQLMKDGNIEVTRTHTTPYNEVWMDAADRNGIGISFEGTWPWLMHGDIMPDKELIDLWEDEFLSMLKKYRNHPSLFFWTVNNEMKFYDNEPNLEQAKIKMKIISNVVKQMRKVDPTRPMCFDSNYKRPVKRFGIDFFKDIDDGDIDDDHSYINWYNFSLFEQFKGEFQTRSLYPGRPLISQEMSTGYPNNETGHPTRFYTILHQVPQAFIGNLAYENANPANFLEINSFITGELAEALRRTNEKSSGILHFALLTWFRNVYDPDKIEPYPTYYAMKRAYQPVLVSAELWGRHFYAGEKLPAQICVVNDNLDATDLAATILVWELVTGNGTKIASGNYAVPSVKYYGRELVSPEINIPAVLPAPKTDAKLRLKLIMDDKVISENEYKVLLAHKEWSQPNALNSKITLVDFIDIKSALDFLKINYRPVASVADALKAKADIYIFAGLDTSKNCKVGDLKQIRALVAKGGKVLILNSEAATKEMYPEYISGWIVPTEGDIANMEVPESPVFNGIEPLELRYFNNNKREIPTVCHVALKIRPAPQVERLAIHTKIHGYMSNDMEYRLNYMANIKGFPIVKITDKGIITVSTMSLEKTTTDPIAGKLLSNILEDLVR